MCLCVFYFISVKLLIIFLRNAFMEFECVYFSVYHLIAFVCFVATMER